MRVYEDDAALAFMDVMPRAEGHTLVIPKIFARALFDIDPQELARLMPVVQKVGRAVMAGMKAEGLSLQQFNETAGGQQVSTFISTSSLVGAGYRSGLRADHSRAPRRCGQRRKDHRGARRRVIVKAARPTLSLSLRTATT